MKKKTQKKFDYDVVVIGSGSAGFAAARAAAGLGARTAVIEAGKQIAGLCILRGCMPSKALLASSSRMHAIQTAGEFGIINAKGVPDLNKIVSRKDKFIKEFSDYREEQIHKGNFDFVSGRPTFLDPHTVRLMSGRRRTLSSRFFIICTGSKISHPPLEGLQEVDLMDSDKALHCRKLPPTLAVLGGGPIALELGQHFSRLGSRVTVIQRSPHLLSKFDSDLADALQESFEKEGIRVVTNTQLLGFEKGKKKTVLFLKNGEKHRLVVDEILLALGRKPNTEGLGLESIGVRLKGAAIDVNGTMQSSVPNIYAAGDVNGRHEVVHIAIQQAEIAARNAIGGGKVRFDERTKTTAVFTEPQVAVVGMSERELKGKKFLVGKYPFSDHGKSMVLGETAGFVKIIAEPKRGKILGAQIVGPHASDLIHEMIALIHMNANVFDVISMPHYHPTLAEILTYPAEEIAEKIVKA